MSKIWALETAPKRARAYMSEDIKPHEETASPLSVQRKHYAASKSTVWEEPLCVLVIEHAGAVHQYAKV